MPESINETVVMPETKPEEPKEFFDMPIVSGEMTIAENKILVPATVSVKTEVQKPVYKKETDIHLPFDQRILAFMESRGTSGFIRLNEFLKSLYPLPKGNEPPKWLQMGEGKRLLGILDKLQSEGKILINNNQHKRLGKFYYAGVEQITQHHNLNDVVIEAKN